MSRRRSRQEQEPKLEQKLKLGSNQKPEQEPRRSA